MSSGVWFPSLGLAAWLCCLNLVHWLSMKILVKELTHRGHEVVVLVPETSLLIHGSEDYKTEIYQVPYTKADQDKNIRQLGNGAFLTPPGFQDLFFNVQRFIDFTLIKVKGCESLLNNQPLMSRLRGKGFDLMLTDPFLPCGSILAHLFSIPAVYFLRGLPCELDMKANQCPSPPSYVPVFYSDNTDVMSFPQRVKNMVMSIMNSYLCKIIYAHFDDLTIKYIRDNMTYRDLISHGAIWLVRTDFALEWPRPLMPNMVFIGGINCAKKAPLQAVRLARCS
uniref:Uncharacterized protein n=1 Tax=Monopterus albus TaxID=43700 RepID=A0A3Q3KCT3_MONAL